MANMWPRKKKNLSYNPDLGKLDMCLRIHVGGGSLHYQHQTVIAQMQSKDQRTLYYPESSKKD